MLILLFSVGFKISTNQGVTLVPGVKHAYVKSNVISPTIAVPDVAVYNSM